jgi:hypothetical protein
MRPAVHPPQAAFGKEHAVSARGALRQGLRAGLQLVTPRLLSCRLPRLMQWTKVYNLAVTQPRC